MSGRSMMEKSDIQSICSRALEVAGEAEAEVALYLKSSALTRFAKNAIHQNVSESDSKLYLRVFDGNRSGAAMTNQFDDQALRAAAASAAEAAQLGPENADAPGLPVTADIATVNSLDEAALDHSPALRAKAVKQACQAAASAGAEAYGAFLVEVDAIAHANTNGLFATHIGSIADYQTVVMHNGSSGWAQGAHWRVDGVPTAELGDEAVRKAVDGSEAEAIQPEPMTVVLDPYATADLITMLSAPGMSAKAVAEGRSWMTHRIGERAMNEQVSIWDDGLDPFGLPAPFDSEGTAKRKVDIIKNGVVTDPVHDRQTAERMDTSSTGHALPYDLLPMTRSYAPLPLNLFMAAGELSTEELIASTERGFYITRFWYTRLVHPSDCVVTGMTRDGVFLIENGKLTRPVKDLRFTQSYVHAMRDVEGLGSETRLVTEDFFGGVVQAPALKISNFRFTGSTV